MGCEPSVDDPGTGLSLSLSGAAADQEAGRRSIDVDIYLHRGETE